MCDGEADQATQIDGSMLAFEAVSDEDLHWKTDGDPRGGDYAVKSGCPCRPFLSIVCFQQPLTKFNQ